MASTAAITVKRPPGDVRRLWDSPEHRSEYIAGLEAPATFSRAPGDDGTEIRVGSDEAKVKDELRRLEAHVETGVISRSDGSPEGERAERKLKQRPAQPLDESELAKAGV